MVIITASAIIIFYKKHQRDKYKTKQEQRILKLVDAERKPEEVDEELIIPTKPVMKQPEITKYIERHRERDARLKEKDLHLKQRIKDLSSRMDDTKIKLFDLKYHLERKDKKKQKRHY